MKPTLRRVLMAGAAALALSAVPGPTARALLGVGDIVYDPAVHAEALLQLEQAREAYKVATETGRDVKRMYDAANTITDIPSAARALMSEALRIPLPPGSEMAEIQNGMRSDGLLGGLMAMFGARNTIYEAPGDDFDTNELNRARRMINGRMSMQQAVYDSIYERIRRLNTIQAMASTANTTAMKQDLATELVGEAAAIQALNVQVNTMNARARAEDRNLEQRRAEQRRMELDLAHEALLGARQARLGGTGPAGALLASFRGGGPS